MGKSEESKARKMGASKRLEGANKYNPLDPKHTKVLRIRLPKDIRDGRKAVEPR